MNALAFVDTSHPPQDAPTRHVARVAKVNAGTLTAALHPCWQTELPVLACAAGLPPLSEGDLVMVETVSGGVVVTRLLRNTASAQDAPLVIDHPQGIVLRVGNTELTITPEGAITLNGQSLALDAAAEVALRGAAIRLN
ncbi:hypothetical protein J2T57_000018 [Natronocella acetinitrilica]|uniref:Uncharacterized protein n=1 Tax=Natronocella acetinitrilica TaxID=414046 RepID=A0AAE3G1F2_9GAMM|nr:hypothetical protein [Natronocella acetinitrilica]MCP1672926.1 hypothetical protein [Natronocella acetinitrilica]